MKRLLLAALLVVSVTAISGESDGAFSKFVEKQGIRIDRNGVVSVDQGAAPTMDLGGSGALSPAPTADASILIESEVARRWIADAAPVVEVTQ